MTSTSNLKISVIIPVHHGGDNFLKCLQSFSNGSHIPAEIIVVADGETDGSGSLAQKLGVRVLSLSETGGPARARNLGAAMARGDIFLFIDADVTISANTVNQIATAFENDPTLDAIIGSYDDAPMATNFLSQYKNLLHHHVHQIANEEASTFWGACGAIRRDVFVELGGFDESYRRPSIEDIELGYRLKKAGGKISLIKSLQVKHLKRWGVGSLLKSDIFQRAAPWTAVMLRDKLVINDLNLRFSNRTSVILVYCVLCALPLVWWWNISLMWAGAFSVLLFALNVPVYIFFMRLRGPAFTFKAVLWHWFSYIYSPLGMAVGAVSYLLSWLTKKNPLLPIPEAQPKEKDFIK